MVFTSLHGQVWRQSVKCIDPTVTLIQISTSTVQSHHTYRISGNLRVAKFLRNDSSRRFRGKKICKLPRARRATPTLWNFAKENFMICQNSRNSQKFSNAKISRYTVECNVVCARRLFPEHRPTVSRSLGTRQHTASSFYTTPDSMPESPHHWGPRDYIQPEPQHSVMDLPHDTLAEMQSSILSELSKLSKVVSFITTRLEKLEESVALNTAKLQVIVDSTTISPLASLHSASPSGAASRRQRTPTRLSVSLL